MTANPYESPHPCGHDSPRGNWPRIAWVIAGECIGIVMLALMLPLIDDSTYTLHYVWAATCAVGGLLIGVALAVAAHRPMGWRWLCIRGLWLAAGCFGAFCIVATMSPKPQSVAMIAVGVMAFSVIVGFGLGLILAICGGIGWAMTNQSKSQP